MAGRGRGGRGRGGRPPGRPRRASSSSVESVHAAHVKYVKESSILKSLSPSLHSDDWPCFVLNDAVVYQKDWRTLGNLLKVDQQGPLYVRGRLEIDPVDHRGLGRQEHRSRSSLQQLSMLIFLPPQSAIHIRNLSTSNFHLLTVIPLATSPSVYGRLVARVGSRSTQPPSIRRCTTICLKPSHCIMKL